MQKITQLWNAGCLGKLAIGFIALIILSCIGSVFGSRRPSQQAIVPSPILATSAPATSTTLPILTTAPTSTTTPRPTKTPKPTAAPQPTETPVPTAKPQPTAAPALIPEPTVAPPRITSPVGVSPLDKNNCPPDAPIKGNVVDRGSRKGEKIYHVPGSSSYASTNPERCFATTADAENAGFRAPAR